MTRRSPYLISLCSAIVTSIVLLSASAAPAAENGAYYTARPVVAPASTRLVVRDTMWKCGDSGCASGTRGKSRPAIVCESLVREVGAVESFRAGGEEFTADALAKCNAKA